MKFFRILVVLLALALAAFVVYASYQLKPIRTSVSLVPVALAAEETPVVSFRYTVPNEPAQDVLLKERHWAVTDLIARDLGLPLGSILKANDLRQGQPVAVGATIVVPIQLQRPWQACASYYDTGTTNADGTRFDPNALSVAVKELPKPWDPEDKLPRAYVTITFLSTGKVVRHVPVRDSGPYIATCPSGSPRAIDVTPAVLKAGGITPADGLPEVEVSIDSLPLQYIVNPPQAGGE